MKLGPKAAAAAIILSASLALTACGGGASSGSGGAAAGPTSLTLGSVADVKSFDPIDAHIGHTMPFHQAVYDTLILRAADGKLAPCWPQSGHTTRTTLCSP